ncbi:MAG: hypothetical protein ACI4JJ_07515 [Huintestinicola sp.]
MEKYTDYSRFKESCTAFKHTFAEKYLQDGGLYCHPLSDGVILAPCSAEEAKSNGANICRMHDVMLMSEDGEEFVPFDIKKARDIASEFESVYLSNLMCESTFQAVEWMIDGKHDTVIISEEHMKKIGKPYAPVTPLTNVVVPLKKFKNNFLYGKGTLENPCVLTQKDITAKLDAYIADKLTDFPSLEITAETEFEVFGTKFMTDPSESRCVALDKALDKINEIAEEMKPNAEIFEAACYLFNINDFIIKYLAAAAKKCGIEITVSDFKANYLKGADEKSEDYLSAVKDAFKKLVSEKNSFGFKYTAPDKDKFSDALRSAEQSSADMDAQKSDIIELLKVRPVNAAVFNLARALSPADAENIENISEYWGKSPLHPTELGEYLSSAYIPSDCHDAEGKLICPLAKAEIIKEELSAASAKYKLKSSPALAEIAEYCDSAEKLSRTYNGTLFDTKEAMEAAVKNEAKLADMCGDLSALDMEELKKLRKYIFDMNLDKKTTGKYLLKIKVAMNDCEENQLKLLCTGIPLKNTEELTALKKKITEGDFDETVAAKYIAQIDGSMLSAQAAEMTALFAGIESADKAKVEALEKELASDRFDKMLKKHFEIKIQDAKNRFAVDDLAKICADIEKSDAKGLYEIRDKLKEYDCRKGLKISYFKAIDERLAKLEADEVKTAFAGIDKADTAKLDELEQLIKSGKYRKSLTEAYAQQIETRRNVIANEEFIKKCETIPQMDKAALDSITAELNSGKYGEDITSKYIPKVKERETALLKSELAALCKDIPSMNSEQLDATEKTLTDKKYPEELTTGYFDTIKARRRTLINAEADALCKDIMSMQKDALAKLREQLSDKKFDQEYVKKYYDKIDERENSLEKEKLEALCKGMDSMKKPELEKLSASLSESGCKKENIAPYLEKVRSLEIKLMKSELEALCKNIPTTPRKELSKLREALSGNDFDKELATKYIEQIDKRISELIKKELADICKNIANSPKDKLLAMKMEINDTPDYAEQGKAYIEQIDSRLKQLDKAEFDKQMASIEKLNMEELEKFTEELEKRKPALDAALYEASVKKCRERGKTLETAELEKLCADISGKDAAALCDIKEKITDGSFTPEYTYPYIKKLETAISDYYVKYYSKLTENMGAMSRAQLIALRDSITENKDGCPADMVTRYTGKVNAKIRESDEQILTAKCRNLSTYNEHMCFELIKDINAMDIDPASKKRFITQVELNITNLKTNERDAFVEQLKKVMAANFITGVHFYVPGMSKVFESQFVAITNSFASIEQFELPVLIHEVTQGMTDEAYMLTVDYLYFKGRNGFGRTAVEQIERFEVKKALFGLPSILMVERSGKTNELPSNIDRKSIDNAVKVLNSIIDVLKNAKAAAKLRELEEIKAAEEAKLREEEEERKAVEAAKSKGLDALAAEKPAEAPKADAKPAESKPAEAPKTDAKTAESKPADAPKVDAKTAESKSAEAPKADAKPAESKPAEAPKADAKPAESKPAEAPKTDAKPAEIKQIEKIKPIKPIEVVVSPIPEVKPLKHLDPIPAAAPKAEAPKAEPPKTEAPKAEAKPAPKAEEPKPAASKVKFCDQCGAKILSDSAKFCSECGNKIIR